MPSYLSSAMPIQQNGRVILQGHEPKNPLALYEPKPIERRTDYAGALTGTWTDTPLSKAFFSAQNIGILQNGLRKGVYDMSKGQYMIGNQNDDALKMIMRSTFLQFAKHSPTIPIRTQIALLNKYVLDYAVRQVYNESQSYLKYLHDISTMAVPIAHPVMTREYEPLELRFGF